MNRNAKLSFVFNASAGGVEDARALNTHFRDDDRCTLHVVERPEDLASTVRQALDEETSRLVIGGGDGSVNLAVNTLDEAGVDREIAIVPLGTGNDLARALDVPLDDPIAAFELAVAGACRKVDAIRIDNDSSDMFVNACSAGFAGRVCATIDDATKQRWGAFAYWMRSLTMLGDLPRFDVKIELDDESFEAPMHGLVVANGRYVGGGFPIAPGAVLDDGLLNLTVIPVVQALDLLGAGMEMMREETPRSEALIIRRSRRLRISSEPPLPFSMDGEQDERSMTAFEVVPAALSLVTGGKPVAITGSPNA